MKITTRYVREASDDRGSHRAPHQKNKRRKALRYFSNREYVAGAVFVLFILCCLVSFYAKLNETVSITQLGIVQSVSEPDWTAGTVTVFTDRKTFKAAARYNITKGNVLEIRKYQSRKVQLCIKNRGQCLDVTGSDL